MDFVIPVNDIATIRISKEGMLTSEGLKEECPYCGQVDCYADCDGSAGDIDGLESEEQMIERRVANARADGLEALVLALVCKGYDPTDEKFKGAVTTACDAIANN
jgi:hypothetical protein